MDFPPLDDARWDRLLGAVIDQRPTVGDPAAPLASPFPTPPTPTPAPRDDDRHRDAGRPAEASAAKRTIHLDRV